MFFVESREVVETGQDVFVLFPVQGNDAKIGGDVGGGRGRGGGSRCGEVAVAVAVVDVDIRVFIVTSSTEPTCTRQEKMTYWSFFQRRGLW